MSIEARRNREKCKGHKRHERLIWIEREVRREINMEAKGEAEMN
jgi:hypothetical protein